MLYSFITPLATDVSELEMTLWDLILKGGWLMIPIFILSLVAVYIACERFFAIRKSGANDTPFTETLFSLLRERKEEEALALCRQEDSPLARVLMKGIEQKELTRSELRITLNELASYEVSFLEKGLATLATCAGTAPMIGFLGTVVGMVQAFYDMAMAGSNIDISLLSRGIYTAMITTVAGLIVGIIGNLAYNYLVALIDKRVHRIEKGIIDLIEIRNT